MKSFFLSPLLALLLLAACQSSTPEGSPQASSDSLTTEATLRWTGMVAADGCGFFLDIDGKEHKASNEEVIPEAFQEYESVPVQLTYELLPEAQEFSCGMLPSHHAVTIRILDIQLKN